MDAQLLKVLLVEDNFREAELFEEFLAEVRRIRFELTQTQRLDETLRLLEHNSFDVILLDLFLPDSQGLETVVSVHSKALLTPIVVLTSLEDEDLAVNAIRSGAQDYLLKGQVNSPLLVHALRYAIERSQLLLHLRETEQRYALAMSGSQVGVWQVNLSNRDIYVSPNLKTLLGYADREIGTSPEDWLNLVHPDDRQPVLTAAIAHLQGLTPHLEIEHQLLHKDGSSRWVLSRGTAFRDATGQPYQIGGSITDITDRKQAQMALLKSQQQIVNIVESITDAYGELGLPKQDETVGFSLSRQTSLAADVGLALTQGGTLSSMLQQCARSLIEHLDVALARIWLLKENQNLLELEASAGACTHPESVPDRVLISCFNVGRMAPERQPYLTNNLLDEPHLEEREWACKEGMVAFLEYPLVLENQLVGTIALFARQPITQATFDAIASVADKIALGIQRKQVEQALERERQQLREIIANAPVAIAMFDTQMRCLVHSQKWASDYGLEGQSIIGRTPSQVFSDIPKHWGAIVRRAFQGEVLSQPEDKWEREDGSTLYLRWAVQPWSTPEGTVGGVVIVTDRINELVEAREAALEASRLKSQFVANM